MASKKEGDVADKAIDPTDLPPNTHLATQVIKLAFVRQPEDLEAENAFFPPLFAHQVFDKEIIANHVSPRIELIYAASDLRLCLRVHPDPAPGASEAEVTDLQAPLQKLIVHDTFDSVDALLSESDSSFTPPGRKISQYDQGALDKAAHHDAGEGNEGGVVFEVYEGEFSDKAVLELHRRMQFLNLLLIDGASYISESDSKWILFTVFEKREKNGEQQYTFAGFATVYRFFAYPDSTRRRVSQVVILPPFQGKGHATQLHLALLESSKTDRTCTETLVEDPTPNFQRVRLVAELFLLNKEKVFAFDDKEKSELWEMTHAQATEIRKKVGLGVLSIKRAHEVFKQKALGQGPSEEEEKLFRLEVKGRLFRQHEDELEGLDDSERKRLLQEMFEATREENDSLLVRLERLL